MWMVPNGKGMTSPRTLRNGKGMKNPRSEHRAVRLELHVVRHGPLACRPTIHVGMHRKQLLENTGARTVLEGRRSPARARARVMARAVRHGKAQEEAEVQGRVAAALGGLREAKEALAESEVELQWRAAVAASRNCRAFC